MAENFYKSDEYTLQNPTYHIEDSLFKSNNFIKLLKISKFKIDEIKNVIDVGCGAGGILKELKKTRYFNQETNFSGFDINKQIIHLANKDLPNNVNFFCEDFFKSNLYKKSDLILCADVYEHIDDYLGFLKRLSSGGKFFLFNIPLDLSVRTILSNKIINNNFEKLGHVHYFNKNIAKQMLNYCNFDIINVIYAKNFLEHEKKKTIKQLIYSIPVKIIDTINEDLSANMFGGYSLVVLAKSKV